MGKQVERSGLTVVLLANGSAYNLNYSYHCRDDNDVIFVNEENFDKVRGLHVDTIVTVGEVGSDNLDKFKTLIRE